MMTVRSSCRRGNFALSFLLALALLPLLAANVHAQGYVQANLVSDIPGLAAFTDPNLVNPWGLTSSPTSPFWVSDNGTGLLTLYNGAGAPQALVVTVPPPAGATGTATPTGQIFNGTSDFQIAPGKPGIFIACTEDGTIAGWNPGVNLHTAMIKVDNSHFKAVYKGLALANNGSANFLFVANFHSGKVEVYDASFAAVHLQGDSFKDPFIPGNYSPFNVQNVGGKLYVTFARRQNNKHDEVDGTGLGFVDVFTPDGTLIQRLQSGWWLNAPWAVTMAPDNFGEFSNKLLVGNFGSGWIAAFDPSTGMFLGLMNDSAGNPITIDGLWALKFGNGAAGGDPHTLYFTAGLNDEQDGLFGSLQPAP